MGITYVGVGECKATGTPGESLKAVALGSSVAVIILAPEPRMAGLLHVALPDSTIFPRKLAEYPAMFADTGIPRLLEEMLRLGCSAAGELTVKLAGGAGIIGSNDALDIGRRNVAAVRQMLSRHRLKVAAEDLGDCINRTVMVEVDSGRTVVSSPGRGQWEL